MESPVIPPQPAGPLTPILAGVILAGVLILIYIVITARNFQHLKSTDTQPSTKYIFLVVGLFELASAAVIVHLGCALSWNLSESFAAPVSSAFITPLNGIVILIVQVTFSRRFSGYSEAACMTLSSIQFGCSVAVGILFNVRGRILSKLRSMDAFSITMVTYLSTLLVCDFFLVAMTAKLARSGSSTPQDDEQGPEHRFGDVNHLKVTVQNGLVTAGCALLNLIFFLVRPHNNIHVFFHLILGPLHAVALILTFHRVRVFGEKEEALLTRRILGRSTTMGPNGRGGADDEPVGEGSEAIQLDLATEGTIGKGATGDTESVRRGTLLLVASDSSSLYSGRTSLKPSSSFYWKDSEAQSKASTGPEPKLLQRS